MNIVNEFLLEIGRKARSIRKSYWEENDYSIRLSQYQGKREAGLWFKTSGCSYDHQGGCIMCDYSIGRYVDCSAIISSVNKGLEAIETPCYQLLVSPSGSMFDTKEVPREALEGILGLLVESEHERFSFETRADTITEEKLELCEKYLGNRFYRLFIGLESANAWILKYCINKQLQISRFAETVNIMKKKGVRVAANIIISIPFLTPQENINLAIESVKWAVSIGCEECFLFPLHVKEATPLATLYSKGMFNPPSLWQLIEIINGLGKDYYKYIRLSWYTSYGAFNVIESPKTCAMCYEQVISLLDHFAEFQDFQSIDELNVLECECKEQWYDLLIQKAETSIFERVLAGYKVLADQYMGESWWIQYSKKLIEQMKMDAREGLFADEKGSFVIGV